MYKYTVGYSALIDKYDLKVIPHYRQSFITTHGRGTSHFERYHETHIYPKTYAIQEPDNPYNQIEFAIKYEGVNLEILEALFNLLKKENKAKEIEDAITKHPTSKYARIIWFLYEYLTESKLNIPDVKKLKYINLLDPEKYFTSSGVPSKRHYIFNNLLGTHQFSPIVRKTKKLLEYIDKNYNEKVKAITKKYDPQIVSRASHYFYTKETQSSYAIEHEKPSPERMTRFINILRKAGSIERLTKEELIDLQNVIVDPRFKDAYYRTSQNYVGENINNYLQRIHYVSPKPKDIERLMEGLLNTIDITENSKVHPVITASIISFGFVFIHPFEDGNGRIHRFLIHYILAKEKFTPKDIIFPVSAVMLQNMSEYDQTLELFSKPLMNLITHYDLSNEGILKVNQPTLQYYKYIDYTFIAEYLFNCIDKTLNEHFEKELEFLVKYDYTKKKIQAIVDMPDNSIDLFIKFVMQNHGKLGQNKRNKFFDKLEDQEILKLEGLIKNNMMDNKDSMYPENNLE